MKQLTTIACLLLFCISLVQSQAPPQALNYQAVARDANGATIQNTNISIRLTLLDGSAVGPALYSETHSVTTNGFGLFTLVVGAGSVVSGTFSAIDWGAGSRFLKVEMDPQAGSNYLVMGTSQLISVPYALYADHANTADSALNPGPQGPAGPQGPPGPAPAGAQNQTIRYGAAGWEASSLIWNDATNVGIGTTSPGAKLDVNGILRTTAFNFPTGATNGYVLTSDASGNASWQLASGGGTLDDAYDFGGSGAGRVITVDAGQVELNGATASGTVFEVNATGANMIGIRADNTSTGVALRAENTNISNTFSAVQAETNSSSTAVAGVVGNTTGAAHGVAGQASATSTAQQAVYGSNLRTNGGHGVRGVGFNGTVGETNYRSGYGLFAQNFDQIGPITTLNAVGVAGIGNVGVVGQTSSGGYGVYSNGAFAATGGKAFMIDHPLDPENKYLKHYSIESPEILNMYRGNVSFDGNGEAEVILPGYFATINKDFSYHLTPIGGAANLFVKQKISNDRFVIGGGQPGMECSWMVIADRNDPYVKQNPGMVQVEQEKKAAEKGKYLMPELYGQPAEKGIFFREVAGERAVQPVMKLEE